MTARTVPDGQVADFGRSARRHKDAGGHQERERDEEAAVARTAPTFPILALLRPGRRDVHRDVAASKLNVTSPATGDWCTGRSVMGLTQQRRLMCSSQLTAGGPGLLTLFVLVLVVCVGAYYFIKRRGQRPSKRRGSESLTNDQIESRSAFAAACRRSLTSASSRAARSMRSCCICARSCWLSTRSCWLSARVCWRSARSVIPLSSFAIASTV